MVELLLIRPSMMNFGDGESRWWSSLRASRTTAHSSCVRTSMARAGTSSAYDDQVDALTQGRPTAVGRFQEQRNGVCSIIVIRAEQQMGAWEGIICGDIRRLAAQKPGLTEGTAGARGRTWNPGD